MPAKRNLQPALDAAQNQLQLTFTASDSLDTKALGILAFNFVLAIFVVQSEMKSQWWLLVPFFATFVASTYCCFRTFWPQDYYGAITDLDDHPEYLSLTEQELVLHLLSDTKKGIDYNTDINLSKTLSCTASIILSLVSIGFVVGCII